MSKYYLDYENFATRNQRLIRGAGGGYGYVYSPKDHKTSLAEEQFLARGSFIKDKLGISPKGVKLKGDINFQKVADLRGLKNSKLGLGSTHATWGERKAARIHRNKEALQVRARKKSMALERERSLRDDYIDD